VEPEGGAVIAAAQLECRWGRMMAVERRAWPTSGFSAKIVILTGSDWTVNFETARNIRAARLEHSKDLIAFARAVLVDTHL
jgi:hypothetical protein